MIRSFRSPDTERLFKRAWVRKFERIERAAQRKLAMLDAVRQLGDLKAVPSLLLVKRLGCRKSPYRIRINDQWHLCFEWRDGDALNVEITDCH